MRFSKGLWEVFLPFSGSKRCGPFFQVFQLRNSLEVERLIMLIILNIMSLVFPALLLWDTGIVTSNFKGI